MKKIKSKFAINKTTIANLSAAQQQMICGGEDPYPFTNVNTCTTYCPPQKTVPPSCKCDTPGNQTWVTCPTMDLPC